MDPRGPGARSVTESSIGPWRELRLSVEQAYAEVLAVNAIYARPIVPVGQLYGEPTLAELERFRQLASAYGLGGVSFFDLESAAPGALTALAAPLPRTHKRKVRPATIRPGADGDEVLWAQELLNAAGARLPAGGHYGAQTARAVGGFQRRHRLPVTGILGPATWMRLLRFHARQPSWVPPGSNAPARGPRSARRAPASTPAAAA